MSDLFSRAFQLETARRRLAEGEKRHALYYVTESSEQDTSRRLIAVDVGPSPTWRRLRRAVHVLFFGWSR